MVGLAPNILFSELHHVVLLVVDSSDDKHALGVLVNTKDTLTVYIEIELEAVPLAVEHVASLPLLEVHLDLKFARLGPGPWDAPLALDDLISHNPVVLDRVLPVVLLDEADGASPLQLSVDREASHLVASLSEDLPVETDLHVVKLNREVLVHLFKVTGPEDLFSCHFFVCLTEHFLSALELL